MLINRTAIHNMTLSGGTWVSLGSGRELLFSFLCGVFAFLGLVCENEEGHSETDFKVIYCIGILQALNVIGYQLGDASKVV